MMRSVHTSTSQDFQRHAFAHELQRPTNATGPRLSSTSTRTSYNDCHRNVKRGRVQVELLPELCLSARVPPVALANRGCPFCLDIDESVTPTQLSVTAQLQTLQVSPIRGTLTDNGSEVTTPTCYRYGRGEMDNKSASYTIPGVEDKILMLQVQLDHCGTGSQDVVVAGAGGASCVIVVAVAVSSSLDHGSTPCGSESERSRFSATTGFPVVVAACRLDSVGPGTDHRVPRTPSSVSRPVRAAFGESHQRTIACALWKILPSPTRLLPLGYSRTLSVRLSRPACVRTHARQCQRVFLFVCLHVCLRCESVIVQ
ncbi:hypothetical protein BaRGS_00021979 [Batillaria attramentaria]|uniref:Uncharacterized protein n=1 Tax=Batillaria attramentaria TaxID=370345 RepID=A0ABD0KIQ0_9CAEN